MLLKDVPQLPITVAATTPRDDDGDGLGTFEFASQLLQAAFEPDCARSLAVGLVAGSILDFLRCGPTTPTSEAVDTGPRDLTRPRSREDTECARHAALRSSSIALVVPRLAKDVRVGSVDAIRRCSSGADAVCKLQDVVGTSGTSSQPKHASGHDEMSDAASYLHRRAAH